MVGLECKSTANGIGGDHGLRRRVTRLGRTFEPLANCNFRL